MAVWGKGDPRWIVEERPDSKNVNNWHWTERDATNWSKLKLKSLFSDLKYEDDEGNWKIEEVKKIDGEATINNRKGKLIFFYEWVVKLEYKGKVTGSDLNFSGTIEIPNLSDENDASEVDITVSTKSDSKNSEKLKNIVRKKGLQLVRDICGVYVKDLKTEYTTGMVLPTKNGNSQPTTTQNTQSNAKKQMNEGMKDLNVSKKSSSSAKVAHVALNLKEEFRTNAEELYQTLTDPQRISAFTSSQCTSNVMEGGEFSIMDGVITGTYTQLIENKKIVQNWRFKDWPEGLNSKVVIELLQKEDTTLLKLTQTGVPDYDMSKTEEGWKRRFFGPIKQVFGFGANLY